jgi:phosphoribosylformylglycinamidine synthase
MAIPRGLVLRAPGTNCDVETASAFERVGGKVQLDHVNRLRACPNLVDKYQILCLPGGFSYGDDIAAGQILAGQLRYHLKEAMERVRDQDKLILGICNGFQALLRSGMLLPEDEHGPLATLAWNDSGRFEDRWVHLAVTADTCVFLRGMELIYLPVAHAEGKFVPRDDQILQRLRGLGQLVLRYSDIAGEEPRYPENPNGSVAAVAGVCDATGRVLGLMPHPERHIDATHHPQWTRQATLPDHGDGFRIFANAVGYFRA